MELDVEEPDRIMYSDGSSLKTIDITKMNESDLTGTATENGYSNARGTAARYNHITGFFQYYEERIIYIVDHLNHCIRKFLRRDKTVFKWVGRCKNVGYKDGSKDDSLFNQPYSLIKSFKNDAFLLDRKSVV